ncbi:MAG: major capsid protein [Marinobacterium sp.]|nr:major capsid protein [Marinobacterium sp.]
MPLDVLDTRTLLGIKARQPKFEAFFMRMFFSQVVTFDTEEIAFDKIKKGIKLAPFVAPMVAGKANRKQGGKMTTFMPAYVKPTDNVNPAMLLKRRPGESMGGSLSPADRRLAVKAQLLDDQEKSIVYREEWMAVQAVIHGAVTVEGEGYETMVVDYGRSPQNDVTLVGPAKWDTVDPATYDPTDDIEDWAERASGVVDTLIFDKKGWRQFSRFKAVKDRLNKDQSGNTSSLQLGPQLSRVVQYKGNFGEYECYVYSGKHEDGEGGEQCYMPAGRLLLAPSMTDDVMAYGAIQDAKANAGGVVAASRYPSNWFTDNPSVEWMQTQSAPLPVMFDADAFVSVKLF